MQFAEEATKQAGLAEYLPLFTRNTQSLQARVRKIVLENVRLRNPEYKDYNSSVNGSALDWQGYQLCTFRDSGSFVWGVVDDFFQPKKVQPEQLKQYNNATVLLWNTPWQERLYTYGDRITLTFKCSYYEPSPLQDASLAWELLDSNGHKFDAGEVKGVQADCGELKTIDVDYSYLPKTGPAQKLQLAARLTAAGREITQNEWDLWVYPASNMQKFGSKVFISELGSAPELLLRQRYPFIEPLKTGQLAPDDLLITGKISATLLDHLAQGGKALLSARYNLPSMFTEWSSSRSEFPRGTVIFAHPLFKDLPQEGWCDIPFAGMISNSVEPEIHRNSEGQVTLLSGWPAELKPIIMGIPSYKDAKPGKLAHLFEVKVGQGRLMVTSFDFSSPKAQNPATNYFFDRLLGYLAGPDFKPQTAIEAEFLSGFSENAPYEPLKVGSGIKLLQPNPKKTT